MVYLARVGLSFGDYHACFRGVSLLGCGSHPSNWFSKDVGWVHGVLNNPLDNGFLL
jgi:hypothetical protein